MAVGYQYVIEGRRIVEPLSVMLLSNDAEALSFAKGIIRDLTVDGTQYRACTMKIITDNRVVAKMPFDI